MTNTADERLQKIYKQSKLKLPYTQLSLMRRYWMYQWERLPLIPLILMGLSVSAAVTLALSIFSWPRLVATTVLVTAYLLQIRFADEPKDFEHDNQFYPTRPVQRGLITLKELLVLRNVSMVIFFLAALSLMSVPVFLLAVFQQFYSYLTRKEFFVRDWLRDHFLTYMFSHYFQLLILSWLAMTALGVPLSERPFYFGFAILLLAVVELGRKIQEKDNDAAADTYSAQLGRQRAIGLFALVVAGLTLYTCIIVLRIDATSSAIFIPIIGAGLLGSVCVRYLQSPDKQNTKLLQGGALLFYFICTGTIIFQA